MQADEQHARIILKHRLSAIAMMDIEIDDPDSRDAMLLLRVAGRDRHVGKEAESHGPIRLGMMPRRSRGGEGARELSA